MFFRFTGGNTIGQVFTPRHITRFAADLCAVSRSDLVIDLACGTGGFLISALHRMMAGRQFTHSQICNLVKKHLIGFEVEPITAALCIANMILRGDGTTGIIKDDCFTSRLFPISRATVGLANPPFPHKKTDDPPEKFVDRALESLATRGKLAMIVPTSQLVRYHVTVASTAPRFTLERGGFEVGLGAGLGDWDFIVEENLSDSIALLSEFVEHVTELSRRLPEGCLDGPDT